MKASLDELFARSVQDTNGCRLWTGAIKSNGYGHVNINGKTVMVHRLSWSLTNRRKIPKGKRVLHSCDVRSCIEPKHLRIGTSAQNSQEMVARGRYRGPRRLTNAQISEILTLCSNGELTQREIARQFGVHEATVSDIKLRKNLVTWKPEMSA